MHLTTLTTTFITELLNCQHGNSCYQLISFGDKWSEVSFIFLFFIGVFTQTVKSIQQQVTRGKEQLNLKYWRRYSASYSWDRHQHAVSSYVSTERNTEIYSCTGVSESWGSCYHMLACRYSTCCSVGQEQVITCLLLYCYNTTIFSRQTGTQKGMWRWYNKYLQSTPTFF